VYTVGGECYRLVNVVVQEAGEEITVCEMTRIIR